MNEYTRREEVRWTLASALLLVVAVTLATLLIVTAKGPMVPDTDGKARAEAAVAAAAELSGCATTANRLTNELKVFKAVAEQTKLGLPPPPLAPNEAPAKDDKAGRATLAWAGAKSSHALSVSLAGCKELASPIDPSLEPIWKTLAEVSKLKAPPSGETDAELEAASSVWSHLKDAPLKSLADALGVAATSEQAAAAKALSEASTRELRGPLPRGLLGREVALGAGVAIAVIGLLISFFSLRATSTRRAGTLVGMRRLAQTPERGLQAAAILKLASESNGGEPGMVLGAAFGGVVAVLVARMDADWFVVGVMGGLVMGLLLQIALRMSGNDKKFRDRALELADIEKPTVSVVLILQTIKPGLEPEFLDYFLKLSPREAAATAEKLATQAEEQILMVADARAEAQA